MTQENMQQAKERICQISTVHPPTDVRIFYRECCSLVKAGYEVNLVIPGEQSYTKEGVHIHSIRRVKNRLLRMLFMPWVAMRKALQTKSSLYHYHDPELLFMGFVLRWVFGKKVIFDIHELVKKQIMIKECLPKWSRKPVGTLYRIVEKILTPGQGLVLASLASIHDYPPSAYLVRNYPLLNEEIISIASDKKQRPKVPLLVYIGVISKVRGVLLSVELAAKLVERGHDFRMQIIGSYTEELGRELKLKIEKLHLQDKVLLTGHMDWLEAMKLVSQATIGMCLLPPTPSYTLAMPTKILEYMMCGTPLLCSNFDTWKPYVEGERVGMMANPTNIDEVADVCEQMLSNPDELVAMGQRGIEAVRTKYNWNTEFRVLCQCYEDLLKNSR